MHHQLLHHHHLALRWLHEIGLEHNHQSWNPSHLLSYLHLLLLLLLLCLLLLLLCTLSILIHQSRQVHLSHELVLHNLLSCSCLLWIHHGHHCESCKKRNGYVPYASNLSQILNIRNRGVFSNRSYVVFDCNRAFSYDTVTQFPCMYYE